MARPKGARGKAVLERESLIRDIVTAQTKYGDARIVDPSAEEIVKMSPLEVMLFAMTKAAVAGNWQQAAEMARHAAPYRHAKLSLVTTDMTMKIDADRMTDDELAAVILSGSGQDAYDPEEGA